MRHPADDREIGRAETDGRFSLQKKPFVNRDVQ